jgi:hypothetical protein
VRAALVVLLCAAALVVASSGTSAPSAVRTASCSQAGPEFSVQIAGNIDGTYWGRIHAELFARIPKGKATVAVWSFGSQENREPDLYGWAAGSRVEIAERCRTSSARAPAMHALRPPLRVSDGWALGRRYECQRRGRVVIRATGIRGGTRLVVWMERSRELIAVAEIRQGSALVRATKRCRDNPL